MPDAAGAPWWASIYRSASTSAYIHTHPACSSLLSAPRFSHLCTPHPPPPPPPLWRSSSSVIGLILSYSSSSVIPQHISACSSSSVGFLLKRWRCKLLLVGFFCVGDNNHMTYYMSNLKITGDRAEVGGQKWERKKEGKQPCSISHLDRNAATIKNLWQSGWITTHDLMHSRKSERFGQKMNKSNTEREEMVHLD